MYFYCIDDCIERSFHHDLIFDVNVPLCVTAWNRLRTEVKYNIIGSYVLLPNAI
jgi:hypothetical protein